MWFAGCVRWLARLWFQTFSGRRIWGRSLFPPCFLHGWLSTNRHATTPWNAFASLHHPIQCQVVAQVIRVRQYRLQKGRKKASDWRTSANQPYSAEAHDVWKAREDCVLIYTCFNCCVVPAYSTVLYTTYVHVQLPPEILSNRITTRPITDLRRERHMFMAIHPSMRSGHFTPVSHGKTSARYLGR